MMRPTRQNPSRRCGLQVWTRNPDRTGHRKPRQWLIGQGDIDFVDDHAEPIPQINHGHINRCSGWRIEYLDVEAGRPVLMELRHGDIEVRLKVDAWNKP